MEINIIDIKVLKYIKKKKCVSNNNLEKKYGVQYRPAVDNLYDNKLIKCPLDSSSDPFIITAALPTKDDWTISENGLYYLANHKEERRLTVSERIINYIFGFVSGLLSGLLLEWLVKTLNL